MRMITLFALRDLIFKKEPTKPAVNTQKVTNILARAEKMFDPSILKVFLSKEEFNSIPKDKIEALNISRATHFAELALRTKEEGPLVDLGESYFKYIPKELYAALETAGILALYDEL
jgi:hypothetical protein